MQSVMSYDEEDGSKRGRHCRWDSKTSTTIEETVSRFTLNCVNPGAITFAPTCPKATKRTVAIRQSVTFIVQ